MPGSEQQSGEDPQLVWRFYLVVVTAIGSVIIVGSIWSMLPADAPLSRAVSLCGGILTAGGGAKAMMNLIRGEFRAE